jgi:hypothetical protein
MELERPVTSEVGKMDGILPRKKTGPSNIETRVSKRRKSVD